MIWPNEIIGERITLACLDENHLDGKYQQWLADPDINQYLETRHKVWCLEDIKKFVAEQNSSIDQILFGIYVEGKHIGNVKLGPINKIHSLGTISLFIGDKEYWNKGLATEAIKLISNFATQKLNIKKLVAGMYSTNLGSLKAFLNAGFSLEGILKSQYVSNEGKRIDLFQVGLVC